MSIVHPFPQNGPAAFSCAQAGCRVCLDELVRRNEGLIHHILRRQFRGDALYDDLVQEGRIGLWKAILRFDPHRGVAFSTYAGVAIQRHIWKAAKPARTPAIESSGDEAPDAQELAEDRVWDEAVCTALHKAVARLPERLRQVISWVSLKKSTGSHSSLTMPKSVSGASVPWNWLATRCKSFPSPTSSEDWPSSGPR